jgi:formate dehydrogenase subunit beta
MKELLMQGMDKGVFDAVLIPMKVPAGDSYVYVLIKEKALVKDADPLPPVMSVQGGKAVLSITRLGKGNLKIAAVMRPCEVRATNELEKNEQVNLENITLISMDCPGVLPLQEFTQNPKEAGALFKQAEKKHDDTNMRPVCQICDNSSLVAGDLHIGTLGASKDAMFIIAHSDKGQAVLQTLKIPSKGSLDPWKKQVQEKKEKKTKQRSTTHKELKKHIGGLDHLIDTFSRCLNCHNCMRACPICFCRLCYFDSEKIKNEREDYMQQAQEKGNLRFPPDTTLFHVGRMTHMSVSCVSCGSCEDACPVSLPVAQVFSMIADETQGLFDYVAGRDREEPLPMKTFKEDELHEMEDAHD